MSRASLTLGGVIAATALALTGCQSVDQAAIDAEALACPEGSDCFDPVIPIGDGGALTVEMGDFFFEITEGAAIEGDVEVTVDNIGGQVHNFRIDAAAGDNKLVEAAAGEQQTGTLQLFSGEYTYYCDIPGHRASGMEGTLTVYTDEAAARDAGALGGDEETEPAEGEESPAAEESPEAEASPTAESTEG